MTVFVFSSLVDVGELAVVMRNQVYLVNMKKRTAE